MAIWTWGHGEPLEAFARAWLAWNDGGWATPKALVPLALQVGLLTGGHERGQYASLGHLLRPRLGLVVAGRRLTDIGPHGRRLYSLAALA